MSALERGQLHSIHNLEGLTIILQRVGIGVLQVVHMLVEDDELTTGLVKFDCGFLQLIFQVTCLRDVVQDLVGAIGRGCERRC